jgi:hypothetical protein
MMLSVSALHVLAPAKKLLLGTHVGICAQPQVRAEFLDILLAVLCFTAPEIEGRLRQVGPGRGRAGAAEVAGAAQLFALAEGQPEAVRKVSWCWLLHGKASV